ncbi:hypothetical protein A9267_08850 [Shewanella sp. UCD-FRSSP16_17]|uniref:acyltransferase family protein n=1 Tax=Shewanella sp. UCD-FRSSP16_17 TaxID=1853256 RepID=UPI0007EEC6BC|nr:acyltransferase [Shewanella sp. UCD-FRSSP16_17]OBT09110.1 hypothetical protein A9267_08850 [Shewanella sp. UCD-FRSSP16_17]
MLNKVYSLDSLRALAVFTVLFMHFGTAFLDYNSIYANIDSSNFFRNIQLQGGKGVSLFFAISGFLICSMIIRKENFSYSEYLYRRLIRVVPPYFVALVIFFVVHIFLGDYDLLFLIKSLISSLTFTHNIVFDHWSYILPVSWSLEIEVQFYLIAPLLVGVMCKLHSTLRITLYLILIFAGIYFSFLEIKTVFRYFNFFLVGVLVAELNFILSKKDTLFLRVGVWADFVFLVSIACFYVTSNLYIQTLSIIFIFFTLDKYKFLEGVFKAKLVVFIGRTSYSNYLLHYPFFYFCMLFLPKVLLITGIYPLDFAIQFTVSFLISIFVIYPFYLFIELPFSTRVGVVQNGKNQVVKILNQLNRLHCTLKERM